MTDDLIQFAAQKLGVRVTFCWSSEKRTYAWQVLDDCQQLIGLFDPCTWEWMGKGLEIMFDEGLLYCIQPHKFIIWPENEVGDETVVRIESIEKTPEAFWQCWMAVEGE